MKHVLLLLANGFEIYEASAFIDVFGWNLEEGSKNTKLISCAKTKNISSSFGLKIKVDKTLDEINTNDFDALAIPGGFEQYGFYEDAFSREFSIIINDFSKRKKTIASICTGALSLAKSGILEGKEATSYKPSNRIKQLLNYKVIISNKRIVDSNNIITSQSPETAVDVAFLLLEKLTTKQNTELVKKLMGF